MKMRAYVVDRVWHAVIHIHNIVTSIARLVCHTDSRMKPAGSPSRSFTVLLDLLAVEYRTSAFR